MTENTTSPVGRAAIDAYLDSIEQALLAANAPRGDRTQVLADLESQIADMLAQQPQPLTEESVQAVIARLEPASHFAAMYGNGKRPQADRTRSISIPVPKLRTPRWSLVAAACFALPVMGLFLEWAVQLSPRHSGAFFVLSIVAALVATPCALAMAYKQLRARPEGSADRDLVVNMILAYAIVAPAFLMVVFTEWTEGFVLVPFGIAAFIYVQYRLVRRLQRYVKDKLPPQLADDSPSVASRPTSAPPMGPAMSMPAI
jgi:cation transport ATPase